MLEQLELFIVKYFGKDVAVFILAMFPLVEIKGAIPFGILMKMDTLESTICAYFGSMVPIYFVLKFTPWCFAQLLRFKHTEKIIVRLQMRAMQKSDIIQKYGYWGLFIFVAIPLPGTGVWMGAFIAAILKLYRFKAFVAIALGNLCSAIIIYLLSTGILTIF